MENERRKLFPPLCGWFQAAREDVKSVLSLVVMRNAEVLNFGRGATRALKYRLIPSDLLVQALFVAWYNSGRKHEALRGATPAMASKLTDYVWTIKELVERARMHDQVELYGDSDVGDLYRIQRLHDPR